MNKNEGSFSFSIEKVLKKYGKWVVTLKIC